MLKSPPVSGSSQAEKVAVLECADGGRVWLVEDYAVPMVAFDFAFVGGASQDPVGKDGAASLMASALDEGAGDLDSDAFHRALDDKAIELSFSADRDFVHGRLKTLTRNIDAAFDLLGLALASARLDQDALDRLRAQITASLRRELSDPDALAAKAWREAAFPNHPYGRPSRGSLESLPRIERADLVAAKADLLAREGIAMAAVGAIDAATLLRSIDRAFSCLPRKGAQTAIANTEPAGAGERRVVDLDVPQTTIRFGLPGLARRDPDHMAGVVVNHILGGGIFSARLFKEVREKRGLAYSVHTQLTSQKHASIFSGGTSTKNERAAESLAVIEEEIEKLAADGPTEEELDKAKKYLVGSYALRFDTSTKIASQLVNLQIENFSVDYLDQRNAEIEAVTLDHARSVAKRLFAGKKLLVASAGRPVGM